MKSLLLRQALVLVALALVPAIGQAIYYRDRVSWQTPIPASELVTVAQARSWGESAIWVDARQDEEQRHAKTNNNCYQRQGHAGQTTGRQCIFGLRLRVLSN